jgi:hypothetical protein
VASLKHCGFLFPNGGLRILIALGHLKGVWDAAAVDKTGFSGHILGQSTRKEEGGGAARIV